MDRYLGTLFNPVQTGDCFVLVAFYQPPATRKGVLGRRGWAAPLIVPGSPGASQERDTDADSQLCHRRAVWPRFLHLRPADLADIRVLADRTGQWECTRALILRGPCERSHFADGAAGLREGHSQSHRAVKQVTELGVRPRSGLKQLWLRRVLTPSGPHCSVSVR